MLELNIFPGTFKFAFKLIDDEILLLSLMITGVIFVLTIKKSIGNTKINNYNRYIDKLRIKCFIYLI